MSDRYFTANRFFREIFGGKTRKIPLNAGFSCPNRDGTHDTRGCIYCDAFGSGPLIKTRKSISRQIEDYIRQRPHPRYIAYFQAFSNTYGSAEQLRQAYWPALHYPEVMGVFIGTRPDCINRETIEVLKELSQRTYVCVELGLQSIHEDSLKFLNRHHDYGQFLQAYQALQSIHVDTLIHLILGIPGETVDMMHATIREMNRLKPRGVKLHMLHVLRDTRLEELYRKGKVALFTRENYISLVVELVESLSPEIVVHRLTGERNPELFVAPMWALDKAGILNQIQKEMRERDTWQGRALGASRLRLAKPNLR